MESPPDAAVAQERVPLGLRIAAIALRSIFVCALLVVTVRVSTPTQLSSRERELFEELAKLEDAESDEEIVKKLQGLGYLE